MERNPEMNKKIAVHESLLQVTTCEQELASLNIVPY